MQKLLTLILTAGLSIAPLLAVERYSTPMRILKSRQRQELKALKLKEKYARDLLKNRRVPDAVRRQLKHQLDRDGRKLREQQRDEREELKDRQRLLKQEWE